MRFSADGFSFFYADDAPFFFLFSFLLAEGGNICTCRRDVLARTCSVVVFSISISGPFFFFFIIVRTCFG